jgi:hypothetical protein
MLLCFVMSVPFSSNTSILIQPCLFLLQYNESFSNLALFIGQPGLGSTGSFFVTGRAINI